MKESDAVWAARLHIKKGTMLSDDAVLAICKELVARVELAAANERVSATHRASAARAWFRICGQRGWAFDPTGDSVGKIVGHFDPKSIFFGDHTLLELAEKPTAALFTDGIKVTP